MNLGRLQTFALAWSVVFVAAAILTVLGVQVLPRGVPGLVGSLHVLLAVIGFFCGILAVRRRAEIDALRWRRVEDPELTSGEREHAHREAETDLKRATAQFLLVGVTLGGWLAYQLRAARPEAGAAMTELLGGESSRFPVPEPTSAETLAAGQTLAVSGSDLLIATPLVLFGLGMLWARRAASRAGKVEAGAKHGVGGRFAAQAPTGAGPRSRPSRLLRDRRS